MIRKTKLIKDKTFLFVDGTNLYAGQYQLFGPERYLDFSVLIEEVEKQVKVTFDKIYFYASYSPKSKKPIKGEKLYLKNEALFYKGVKRTKHVVFFTGYRSKTSGKEKEVDVKLTADLISLAFLDKYQTVYLFTGDADFLQALFSIKNYYDRKKIYLLCLENKVMFQGLYYFKTFIIVLKNVPFFRKKVRNIEFIKINRSKLVQAIE